MSGGRAAGLGAASAKTRMSWPDFCASQGWNCAEIHAGERAYTDVCPGLASGAGSAATQANLRFESVIIGARRSWSHAGCAIEEYGGPGRTRTFDQGIMSPLL